MVFRGPGLSRTDAAFSAVTPSQDRFAISILTHPNYNSNNIMLNYCSLDYLANAYYVWIMRPTRERVLELLRFEGGRTIEDLSTTLKLTRTAITAQLAALQAEGLVHRQGLRPGPRRPSVVYELTAMADRLFPKAYDEFAFALVEEIKQNKPDDLVGYLRHIARRWIARDLPALEGFRGRDRMDRVKDILTQRGFMPVLEQSSGGYLLHEHNCPLIQVAVAHPEICDMVHHWLEALFDARLDRVHCLSQGDRASVYAIGGSLERSGGRAQRVSRK